MFMQHKPEIFKKPAHKGTVRECVIPFYSRGAKQAIDP